MTARAASRTGSTPLAFGLVALTPLAAVLGFAAGQPLLLPVLVAAPAYTAMVILLRRGWRTRAVGAMLLWALLLGASMTLLSAALPGKAKQTIVHGEAYWTEMESWLDTGQGRESDPSRFVPQHLLHGAAFVVLSLASASILSIVFGAVLMDYMAYYVSAVIRQTPSHPVLAGLLAWHPWSLLRIASFVVLGVVLAETVLFRVAGGRRPPASARPWIGLAALGLVADIVLKALLAPAWPHVLRSLQ